ncbi:MAG: DedA family protein [Terriglobales bacterium]
MITRLFRKNAILALLCGLAVEAWIAIPGEALIAATAARVFERTSNQLWSWLEVSVVAVGAMLVNDLALFSLSRVARDVVARFIHLPRAHFHLSGMYVILAKFVPPLRSAAFVLYGFEGTRLGHFFYISAISSVIWVLAWALLGKTFRQPIVKFLHKLDGGNRWVTALEVVLTVASVALIFYPL